MKYDKKMLIRKCASGEIPEYLFFWGHTPDPDRVTKACLSQWYACEFWKDGILYHSAEQYMMAQKALLFEDYETYAHIMTSDCPKDCKALGRKVRGFSAEIWDTNKYDIVLQGSIAKFSSNPELWEYLDSTAETVLVEASPYDDIWGVALAASDPRILEPKQWCGDNLLGFALMETRDILRDRCQNNMATLERIKKALCQDTELILKALGVDRACSLVRFQEFDWRQYYSYFRKNEDSVMPVCILFKEDGLWGAVSTDGRILTEARWDDIGVTESGFRIYHVDPDDYYAKYSEAQYFLTLERKGKLGILDTLGRTITPCKWDEIDRYGNCRAGELWGFVNLLTTEETVPQWNENQNLKPYAIIDIYEESIAFRGFGPSCAWEPVCEIFDGSCLRSDKPGDDPRPMA